jgi:hypothetical protein
MPEQQFLMDGQSHREVADLLTRQRGSSKVVWAGVGQVSAGVGESEMGAIRNAIGAFPFPLPSNLEQHATTLEFSFALLCAVRHVCVECLIGT